MTSAWQTWLSVAAGKNPDGEAYVDEQGSVTFAELLRGARRTAHHLAGLGLKRHDRMVSLVSPSGRFLELFHAVQMAGLTLVPLNTRLRPEELARTAAHADPALIVHDREHAAVVPPVSRGVPRAIVLETGSEDMRSCEGDVDFPPPDPNAVLAIVYTSGTTGASKGVVLTSAAFEAGARASVARLGCRPGDRWLGVMPMYHVGGLSIPVRCALGGMTLVQHERFDELRVDRSLREDGINFVSLVPTMLARVLDAADGAPYPATLRSVVLGGGRVPASLVARAAALDVPLVTTFGMTETAAQVTASRSGDAVAHPGSAGHPLEGVEIFIDAPNANGIGEIVLSAAQACCGYFRDAERTRHLYRSGHLHTGDLGRIDADGRLWVESRRTDLIVTGGENVNPEEVEETLSGHPDVHQAAVFGVEDGLWGQVVAAAVVPAAGCGIDEVALEQWCRARLAAYKVPRRWHVCETLPRTGSGKLQRHRLRRR